MPAILNLPTELIFFVASNLDKSKDLSSLACTNRKFYEAINPIIYAAAAARRDGWPLAWAAHSGVAGTLRKALAAGSDPNFRFSDSQPLKAWKRSVTTTKNTDADIDDAAAWESRGDADSDNRWSPMSEGSHGGTTVLADSNSPPTDGDWNMMADDTDTFSDRFSDDVSSSDPDELLSDDSDADSSTLGYSDATSASDLVSRTFTPLHLAAKGGHIEAVAVLLDYGAIPDSYSENFCGCKRAAGLLNALESPAAYEDRHPPTWSPLHTAICHSHQDVARLLLSRGASCMMEASLPGPSSSTARQNYASTALHHAAGMGLTDLVRTLVEGGYQKDVDISDRRTLTPLYYAYARERWDSTVPLLLGMGADINKDIDFFQPYCSITPLGEACRLGRYDVAERLIVLGANATFGFFATGSGHRKGLSPLHLCCMPTARLFTDKPTKARMLDEEDRALQRMRMMELLIAKGSSIQETDCAGDTPVIIASQNRMLPSVRALIRAGADVHAKNAVGRNAVMMALLGPPSRMPGAPPLVYDATLAEIINELFRSGARIGDVDPHGNTVLHLIFKGNPDKNFQMQSLRLLLNNPSANDLILAKNSDGHSPFHLAFEARNIGACEILVRRGYVRGAFHRDELVAMLRHVLQDRSAPQEDALNFVMDLDINRQLTSDPAIFGDLLQEGSPTALLAARLISSRGLPVMSREISSHYLRLAIFLGEWEMAYSMIEGGADVNDTNTAGESALSVFIQRYGYTTLNNRDLQKFVRILLDRGANLHACHPAPLQSGPLAKAIQLGSSRLVSILLEKCPLRDDPQAVNGRYLHLAVQEPSAKMPFLMERMLDTLIESGASLTELDDNGDYPLAVLLQVAAYNSNITRNCYRFIKTLYGPGVDINRKNRQGQSIADLLAELLHPGNKWSGEANALADRLQLVDAPGGKELRFGLAQRPRIRPADIWRP